MPWFSWVFIGFFEKNGDSEIAPWQNRPPDEVWPIAYSGTIRVKVRQDNRVINKVVYLAVSVTPDGIKEVLGLWTSKMRALNSGFRL
jgi:transposase-like protein